MWIRRLGEERLLSRGERDIGWRKDPRPGPRHLGDAILVEERPALVVGSPWAVPCITASENSTTDPAGMSGMTTQEALSGASWIWRGSLKLLL